MQGTSPLASNGLGEDSADVEGSSEKIDSDVTVELVEEEDDGEGDGEDGQDMNVDDEEVDDDEEDDDDNEDEEDGDEEGGDEVEGDEEEETETEGRGGGAVEELDEEELL